jgi:hypothetical protein
MTNLYCREINEGKYLVPLGVSGCKYHKENVTVLPRDLSIIGVGRGGGVSANPADSLTHAGLTHPMHMHIYILSSKNFH